MRKASVAAILLGMAGTSMAGTAAQARDPAADDGLRRAIDTDDLAGVYAALAGGADVRRPGAFGATPLARAVEVQDAAIVAALLARGARVDQPDADGVTPLSLACERGDPLVIAHLLDAHADGRRARPDGVTPLAICARFGPAAAVGRMLAAGAAADVADARGQTPLMWAAAAGRGEAVARLLAAKADPNRRSAGGMTPLFFAIKSGVPAVAEALLAAGASTQARGPEDTSALQLALYQANWPVAARLATLPGADLAARDRNGQQPLHVAAAGGDAALIRALLAAGADPNGVTGASRITWVTEANFGVPPPPVPPTPPLLLAAANGHAEAMALLVAAGADPHAVVADGTNVVLAAARGGSAAALEWALALAPDANVTDRAGATPLHVLLGGIGATMPPELEAMLRVLAAHGARVDRPDQRGTPAVQLADDGLGEVRAVFRAVFPAAVAAVSPHPGT